MPSYNRCYVVITNTLNIFGLYHKIGNEKINAIIEEIKSRITSDGIKQFREGFVSSEATYCVLFFNYMSGHIEDLQNYYILDYIVDRIYRNLEILNFSQDTNYDLLSETFYSIESLTLFNCIETKQMILHLVKYLFPQEIVDKILKSDKIARTTTKFRHFKVNRITGEIKY